MSSVFSISKRELVPRMGEVASNQAVACCYGCLRGTDSCRSFVTFLHIIMVGSSCDRIAKEERCFHCVITYVFFPSAGRNEGRFERCQQVCVQTNQVDDEFEGSNSNEPPFHRHIVLNGGLAKMASMYAPELVNTVLRGLRQQMLDDGWISGLEL